MKRSTNKLRAAATLLVGCLALQAPPLAGQIPFPAPRDAKPLLRADEKWHEMRRSAAPQTDKETNGVPALAVTARTRKDTGLRIARFKDERVQRLVDVRADEILVKFRETATDADKSAALSLVNATLASRRVKALQRIRYERVSVPAGVALETFLDQVRRSPSVQLAEANPILRSQATGPDDLSFPSQWGLPAVRAAEAWNVTRGNPSVIVAVIDSGIDLDHPGLMANLVPGYDFIADTPEADDDFGHGTQVAGIIAAGPLDSAGISGVAPECRIMPLKTLDANGEGTAGDVAEAILYAADNGCRVINLSLGTYAWSAALKDAVDYAVAKDCVIVCAGGNNGAAEPCYPAAYPATIGVAAIDQFQKACFFGNRAPYIDVSAPGKDILTTVDGGGQGTLTGSSAAAAHVSGLAALLVSAIPDATSESVRGIIRATANDLNAPGWDNETGFGLVDCARALSDTATTSPVDVGVVDVLCLPAQVRPGQAINARVTVRNHGALPAGPCRISLRLGNEVVSSSAIIALSPKQTQTVVTTWPSEPNEEAETLTLSADIAPLPAEVFTSDNSRDFQVPLTREVVHDVAILRATASAAPLTPGSPVMVTLELANAGNAFEREVLLRCRGQALNTSNTFDLEPGELKTAVIEWRIPDDTPGPGELSRLYALTFVVEGRSGETNTANNQCVLKFGQQKEHNQIIPFHATGASYGDAKYVHQWIATNAYRFFVSQVEGADLDTTYLGSIPGSFNTGNNDLLKGTFAEDQDSRDPLNQSLPYMNHFCAGADGSELDSGLTILFVEYDSAYEQANKIWQNYAKTDYPGNKPRAYYRLGHVAHLLTDMTVPAHVHNDSHPLYEPYEDAMAYYDQFTAFYYGCTNSGLSNVWNYPLSLDYTNLRAIFYRTANYTEDYDSDEGEGDGPPYFYPSDYPMNWHRPAEVHSDPLVPDDIDATELTIMADDLMPYAIRRVAELCRIWYKEVDATGPTVAMTYPTSENPNEPTVRDSLSAFNLAASANDPESGILKRGYQYRWSYWTGSGWSAWSDVSPSPAAASVSFTPSQGETSYAFYVIAENGGGHQTLSNTKYVRIYPRLFFQQSGKNLILIWSSGTLLSADDLTGPWSVVSGATSPWTNALSGPRKFFRLKQ